MHIVLATLEYPTEPYRAGGMCWAFAKIARGLRDLGHQITVVVTSDRNEIIHDDNGIPVRRYRVTSQLPPRIQRAMEWRFQAAVDRYNQAMSLYRTLDETDRTNRIDVVFSAATPDSYFAAGSSRWNYVVRTSGHWNLIDVGNYMPQTPGRYFADWMEYGAMKASDARVSPSRLHCELYESIGVGHMQHVLTPVATEIPRDPSVPTGRSPPGYPSRYLLFYGSFQARKGTLVFADALVRVLGNHPDLHVVFVGRDLNVPELGSMADRLREKLSAFADRTHIHGVLDQNDAFEVIRHAEWVVMPAIIDNLPNTMLEAMQMGRPVIVTRNSGTDDVITDGRSGIVVNPNDVESLRLGIERALAMTASQRDQMGEWAKRDVQRACDPAKIAHELDALFLVVTKSGGHQRSGFVSRLRLVQLHVAWAIRAVRYMMWGVPQKDAAVLQALCQRYMPGYRIIEAGTA